MRELVTKVRTLKKAGEKNPFVYVDLKKFLPTYCAQHVAITPKGRKRTRRMIGRRSFMHVCVCCVVVSRFTYRTAKTMPGVVYVLPQCVFVVSALTCAGKRP